MHSGQQLGEALKEAMRLKKVTQTQVASHFKILQPSVSNWIKTGRIHKDHIAELIDYFSDVVGPEHWGLTAHAAPGAAVVQAGAKVTAGEGLLAAARAIEGMPDRKKQFIAETASALLQAPASKRAELAAEIDAMTGNLPMLLLIDEPELHLHPVADRAANQSGEWEETLRNIVEGWAPGNERDFLLGVLAAADKATGMKGALRERNAGAHSSTARSKARTG